MPHRKPTCTCGTCTKCRTRERVRRWQRDNPQKVRERTIRYRRRHRARYLKNDREYQARVKEQQPEKVHARQAVYRAIQRGQLERPATCQACGKKCKPQAHHEDYGKPLEVRWFCPTCHAAQHPRKDAK